MPEKYFQISAKNQQELLSEFCEALLNIHTTDEVVKFLSDLLTKSEVIMLAKRIKIAKLLIEGRHYETIERALNVSHGTIAKVAIWLSEAGEGFRLVAKRAKKPKPPSQGQGDLLAMEWRGLKRRYPMMFWPQLLIEGIVESANKKQKEKIRRAIQKLDHKSQTYKQINTILRKDV